MRRTTAKAFSVTRLGLFVGFRRLVACMLFYSSLTMVSLASAQQRPPATPLIVHDPYFSVWSMTDRLTDGLRATGQEPNRDSRASPGLTG